MCDFPSTMSATHEPRQQHQMMSSSVSEEYGVALYQKLQISLTVQEMHICHYLQHAECHSGLSLQLSRLSDQGGMLIDTVHKAH